MSKSMPIHGCSEITVTLKDNERKYTQKFLIYDPYHVNQDDPIIVGCINDAMKSFEGQPEQVKVRINLEVV